MEHVKAELKCVVIGAGGHALVVIEALRRQYRSIELQVIDPSKVGARCLDLVVMGGDELLPTLKSSGFSSFVVAIGSMPGSSKRMEVFERVVGHGLSPLTIIHPGASVSPSAEVGPGSQILCGAVVGPQARIGKNVIVNHSAIVDHGCRVGNHCHISIGAKLAGDVTIQDSCHVGMGASVLERINIGQNSVVGAGALVLSDVEAGVTVVGVPATKLETASRR